MENLELVEYSITVSTAKAD